MQVLLLLTSLTLRGGRKVIVGSTAVALQVMEGQVGQVGSLLHAQVLEGLGCGVDLLVEELAFHLVSGHGVPPEILVEVVGEGLEDGFGEVDVTALLDDFAVDQLGDLGGRVVLGSVQLECLTGGSVVVQHALQSGSDVDGLYLLVGHLVLLRLSYVDGPEALLHVVGSEDVANLGQLVEEVVLETEHGSGTDDGGLGVDVADDFLTPGLYSSVSCTRVSCSNLPQITDLGSEVLGGRVPAGIVGGNVNEAVDIVLGDSIRDALNTVHMDILV